MTPLDYLYSRLNYERVSPTVHKVAFRLRRMRHLLARMDDPQRSFHIVHVGGTKGKGSTCTLISNMLLAAGHRVGLYTSPHLEQLEERFRVDDQICQTDQMLELIEYVRIAAEEVERMGEGAPTFFELTTAMAFEHFRRQNCNVSVIEVGLGGRLDSTNVCDPAVSVLTSVGLDHQHILGDTIEKIAAEKAGIIKPGVPVVSGFRQPGPSKVVRETAIQRAAPLWEIGVDFDYEPAFSQLQAPGNTLQTENQQAAENRFNLISRNPAITTRESWTIGMEGAHQQHNAAIALAAIDALQPIGLSPTLPQQQQGLLTARCPGRIQRFSGNPETILDTAHNVDSIKALRAVLLNRPARGKTVVVFGTSADKDAQPMLAMLQELADSLILTRYWSNPRWYDPQALAHMTTHSHLLIEPDPKAAYSKAREISVPEGRIVVCGSFFLAAELLPTLRSAYGL